MAPIMFALLSLACIFQTLAAPVDRRAVSSPQCNGGNVDAIIAINAARNTLGAIDTSKDIGNARNILTAQLSLLDANNGATQIADSLLTGAPPAPADAQARIVSGLQGAQDALNKTFSFDANVTAAVQAASASIAKGLPRAQEVLSLNCTTTPT
ncbi:hypothetical protein C8J57DRAFT_1493870 [Mycena rebaudengoi]|nr:hypothetical protein C8J57DRAFT_1493870 [Mycena rebaudengoi]